LATRVDGRHGRGRRERPVAVILVSVRVGSLDVRLSQRPLPDNDGYEFLGRGAVVGTLRCNDGRDNVEAGWWLEPARGEPRLVWRSARDADLSLERAEHEPAARWFAQAMLASEIADDLDPLRQRRPEA
jgi:hypothetical protein